MVKRPLHWATTTEAIVTPMMLTMLTDGAHQTREYPTNAVDSHDQEGSASQNSGMQAGLGATGSSINGDGAGAPIATKMLVTTRPVSILQAWKQFY